MSSLGPFVGQKPLSAPRNCASSGGMPNRGSGSAPGQAPGVETRTGRWHVVRKLLGVVMGWGFVGAVLVDFDFWEAKPFTMWSPEELNKVFTDSPWSRTVSVIVVSPPRGGGLDENEGGSPC